MAITDSVLINSCPPNCLGRIHFSEGHSLSEQFQWRYSHWSSVILGSIACLLFRWQSDVGSAWSGLSLSMVLSSWPACNVLTSQLEIESSEREPPLVFPVTLNKRLVCCIMYFVKQKSDIQQFVFVPPPGRAPPSSWPSPPAASSTWTATLRTSTLSLTQAREGLK